MNEKVLSRKLWKLEVAEYIVLLMIVVYVAVFSHFTIMRHYSFRSNAWDLGILVQSVASTTKGELFTNNVELYFAPTGSYFGIHFCPILFTLVPFFSLVPRVETIFVMQSLILALGSVPTYLIAKHCLNSRVAALFISASYLLNPSLQGINWYDFTPQVFFPLFILSTTYFLKKRKPLMFLFFTVLTLMTLEQAAYFLSLYAFYAAWELRADIKNILSPKRTLISFLPLITLAVVIIWVMIVSNIKYALNPNPPEELLAIGNYELLEINSISEIPAKAFTNPDLFLKAIRFDFPNKLLYVLLNFAPSGFVSFMAPVALLPSFLWLFLSILSNWPPYYQVGFQYLAFTVPFIVIATIEGVQNLGKLVDSQRVNGFIVRLPLLLLILGLILSVIASPLSAVHKPRDFTYFRDYGVSTPSSLDNELAETLKIIPDDASVITIPTIFPHLSTDLNAYVIPPVDAPSPRLFRGHLTYLKSIPYDYVVFTYYWDQLESDTLYKEFIENTTTFGLFVKGPGVELYKNGYTGEPTKLAIKFSQKQLFTKDAVIVDDASSDSGKVIKLKSQKEGNIVWFGPYITLAPGNYTANFRIKTDQTAVGKLLTLDVWSKSMFTSDIASYIIYGEDFRKSLTWQTFSVPFTVTQRTANVEFRGLDAASDVTIWADYVEVIPK
jgi:uncharacterized membrane protein